VTGHGMGCQAQGAKRAEQGFESVTSGSGLSEG